MRIAAGITTAPRKCPTFHQSYGSIVRAGFDPFVYAEPNTIITTECNHVFREERLGCWGNWIQSLRDTLEKERGQLISLFQDDAVLCLGVHDFLCEQDIPKDAGVISLYSPTHKPYKQSKEIRLLVTGSKFLLGALAFVFPRHVAEEIAKANDWRGHYKRRTKLEGIKRKAVDTFVGHEVARLGFRAYHYSPSLCQHIAEVSTVGHGRGLTRKRRADSFVGESFDLSQVRQK